MTTELTALAWVGEDELGSGQVGIKRVLINDELQALVLMESQAHAKEKLTAPMLLDGLQSMANHYRKPLRLVRLQVVEELMTIEPHRSS